MRDILPEAYKGKRILVTGHTGFKGSWLAIWLKELGAEVIGYSLDPYSSRQNFVLSGIASKITDLRGDIRDKQKLEQVFSEYKPELVFHLAAQPIVKIAYDQPCYTFEVNILGTINVLEQLRVTPETKAAVIITSDKCYENKEWVWGYREDDLLGGHDPYSASKACAELIAAAYRRSFFTDNIGKTLKAVATVRAGNVIGGGDWSPNRLIPDCIRALEEGREIVIRNPSSTRPWQHVLEPLSGYLLIGAKMLQDRGGICEAWNFGPIASSIVTVGTIVDKLVKLWGNGSYKYATDSKAVGYEAGLLSLDISKANHRLGWYPRWSVEKALEKVVEWYKNYNTEAVYDLCVKQINEYINQV